jgi:uncharacterized membrane protein
MFGSLLGTLAKFRQEESSQKDKVIKNFNLIPIFIKIYILIMKFVRKKNEPKLNKD